MDRLAADIAKMEYGRLSAEIATIQSEINQIARYAVISSAAIFSIIVTEPIKIAGYYYLLKPLPFIITALFSFRVFALYMRLELISVYIEKNFEKIILQIDYPELGWETHLNDSIRKAKSSRSFSQISAILFWVALNVLCFIFIIQ